VTTDVWSFVHHCFNQLICSLPEFLSSNLLLPPVRARSLTLTHNVIIAQAEIQNISADGTISLHTRSLKYGKMENGQYMKVPSGLVRRQPQVSHGDSYDLASMIVKLKLSLHEFLLTIYIFFDFMFNSIMCPCRLDWMLYWGSMVEYGSHVRLCSSY
jgi:hypothetical protein